jgi:hypothetical protein
MTFSSHIRQIALVAVIGCAILAIWTRAAAARPIDDPSLPNAPTAEPLADSSDGGTVPIALAAAIVLVAVGAAGGVRVRMRRKAIA